MSENRVALMPIYSSLLLSRHDSAAVSIFPRPPLKAAINRQKYRTIQLISKEWSQKELPQEPINLVGYFLQAKGQKLSCLLDNKAAPQKGDASASPRETSAALT